MEEKVVNDKSSDVKSKWSHRLSTDIHGFTLGSNGRSYQFRALTRNAITMQKRNWATNLCCVAICPFLMVLFAWILSNIMNQLLHGETDFADVLYCSNLNSMDPRGFPLWNSSDTRLKTSSNISAAPGRMISHVNFIHVSESRLNSRTNKLNTAKHPCVQWFGSKYPQGSVYEPTPDANSSIFNLDSMYLPQPSRGWFDGLSEALGRVPRFNVSLEAAETFLKTFDKFQRRPWTIVDATSGAAQFLGNPPSQTSIRNLTEIRNWAIAYPFGFRPFDNNTNTGTASARGLLESLETRVWVDLDTINKTVRQFQFVPFFEIPSRPSKQIVGIDERIVMLLNATIAKLAALPKPSGFWADLPSFVQSNPALEANISNILRDLPYTGLFFESIDIQNLGIKYTVSVGSDPGIEAIGVFPTTGFRRLLQQAQISSAFLRMSNSSRFGRSDIVQGIRAFPSLSKQETPESVMGQFGTVFFPFGLSFLLPVFVVMLVKEKEERIVIMMIMNGLKPWIYTCGQWVVFFILYIISVLVFVTSAYFYGVRLVTDTSPWVLLLVFYLWGQIQVSTAFLLAAFFRRTRDALVFTSLIVFASLLLGLTLNRIFDVLPTVAYTWPPIAFYRVLYLITTAAYSRDRPAYTFEQVIPGDEVHFGTAAMGLAASVIWLIPSYLETILPSEFGIRRPWYYPFLDLWDLIKRLRKKPAAESDIDSTDAETGEVADEDVDVAHERRKVRERSYQPCCPLVIENMRKVHTTPNGYIKVGVENFSLAIEAGVVFGLLGPNGAGKTSLIHILTGLRQCTSGTARIAGYDLHSHTAQVYRSLGVCPQFDILWEDLTPSEHLYFYARLRGVPKRGEAAAVTAALKMVSLVNAQHRRTKFLSLGEKRRLSIAIALVGDPKVVILDEPTSGLDPEGRRQIWSIIERARSGRTILMTTHTMEEAEICCNRIGIMARGALRCIGSQRHLKMRFGSGLKVSLTVAKNSLKPSVNYIRSILPDSAKLLDCYASKFSFELPLECKSLVPNLFEKIELLRRSNSLGIIDWGISQTSLEEVFCKITRCVEERSESEELEVALANPSVVHTPIPFHI